MRGVLPDQLNDNFGEKMAEIYKRNSASPLFVRAAALELQKNDPHTALQILNDGIKLYHEYPTAFILLGKVHMEIGNFDLAEEAFRKGCDLIGSSQSFGYYISELETKKSSYKGHIESRRVSFFDPGNSPAEPTEIPEVKNSSSPASVDERLEDIAKQISFARIKPDDDNEVIIPPAPENRPESPSFITETLANIYISQGKFNEAIDVCEKLKIKNPDKKEYYDTRIKDIKEQLGDLDWL